MVLSVESRDQAGRRSFLNRQGYLSGLAGCSGIQLLKIMAENIVITGNNEWVISMWARQGGPTMKLLVPVWTQNCRDLGSH